MKNDPIGLTCTLTYIPTDKNVADFFTKGLPKEAFCDFKRVLMGSISHNH